MYCNETAVEVSHLSKAYKLFDSPTQRFLFHLMKNNLGKDFWALNDIDFSIKKGESFAIIGKNGSGKSTLLQILAGIIKPTKGSISINGKISALLELGSGFNPENTGYENIYMNAAILGLDKKNTEEKIDEIIMFADIGEHISQPVKTYSSGMYIRLAFAVAINVNADIIIIDEALAVGDVFFRQKCYSKLNELKEQGKTIILVTHSMNEAEQFCDRALLLSNGKQNFLGHSGMAVKQYYFLEQSSEVFESNQLKTTTENKKDVKNAPVNQLQKIKFDAWEVKEDIYFELNASEEVTNGKAVFKKIGLFDESGFVKRSFEQGSYAYFYMEIEILEDIDLPIVGVVLFDQKNIIIHGKNSLHIDNQLPEYVKVGTIITALQKIKLDVGIGEYTFEAGFSSIKSNDYAKRMYQIQEEVDYNIQIICVRVSVGMFSVIPRKIGQPMKIMFCGSCDLQGDIDMYLNV